MKKISTGNSRLFYIEFLIVLFFFLIISTVCLKIFVQAHRITQHASDLSLAQTMAASAAELLLAGYPVEDALEICTDKFSSVEYTLYITESDSDADTRSSENSFSQSYTISVRDSSEEMIYELALTAHTPVSQKENSETETITNRR